MIWLWLIPVFIILALGVGVFAYRHARLFGHHIQIERTQQLFLLQHDRLEAQFFQAAAARGEPPGLRWKSCAFDENVLFARERTTGQLTALVGMRAELESVENANGQPRPAEELRQAAALFYFRRGHWHAGKAILDMTPAQVLEQLQAQYQPLARHHAE